MTNRAAVGENITATIKDNTLTLEIDLNIKGSLSASGKTSVFAKTLGPVKVPGTNVTLNLQAWRK